VHRESVQCASQDNGVDNHMAGHAHSVQEDKPTKVPKRDSYTHTVLRWYTLDGGTSGSDFRKTEGLDLRGTEFTALLVEK